MKHIKIASALAVVFGLAAVGSANAAAASAGGTITFTGAVTDNTCTVTGGAGTNGGQGNFTVALAPVLATALANAGSTANPKSFNVVIGGAGQTSCVGGIQHIAAMSFLPSSPQVDPGTGTLINALTGQATNANVQLLDSTGTVIALNNPANVVNSPAIANNTTTIPLTAQYFSPNGGATPGLVSTSVIYSVTYQ